MWPKKKSHAPQTADPEPKNWQSNEPPKPAPSEGTTKTNKDVMFAAGATEDRAPSRLGSSMRVKGEILGNEDLDIDGTVEGLVHIDEQKLTVGATAKLAADIIAGEVIVYGSVKGNVRGKGKVEIKKDGSVKVTETCSRGRHLHRLRRQQARGRGLSNHQRMLRILLSG